MRTVLWISRHALSFEQREDLERICRGPFFIRQIQETVENIVSLAPAIAEADVIAAVLPTQLLADLAAASAGKPVLVEKCIRTIIPQTSGEPKTIFRHGSWMQVAKLEYKEQIPDYL